MKNTLVKNTLILIVTSLLIRMLSLVNRIILTRLLGNEGISLYVIVLPSIMLFMSIAGFSLNTALSKVISENLATGKYQEKNIIKSAAAIGFLMTGLTALLVLIIIKPLVSYGLKQENAFYPILSSLLFLPLVMLNNVFRGYFNGRNQINISAFANLIEQVTRIGVGILFLYLFLPYGLITSVTMSVLSMGVGELISLVYIIIRIRKCKQVNSTSNASPSRAIIQMALPTTCSRLIGNLTEFLEPIIYTAALSLLGFTSEEILFHYSSITAYALPLIAMCSFISQSIATSIIPNISRANALGRHQEIIYYIKKSLLLSLVPGILVTILLLNYSYEYMNLVYKTSIGADYAIRLGVFFIFYYLLSPLWAIMQALGKTRFLFRLNLISSILKLALMFGLSFLPGVGPASLILVLLLNTIASALILYFYLTNQLRFRFHLPEILKLGILTLASILALEILKAGISHYLLNTILLALIFIFLFKVLKVADLHDK
jgi:stage V sporulation protein B